MIGNRLSCSVSRAIYATLRTDALFLGVCLTHLVPQPALCEPFQRTLCQYANSLFLLQK